MAVAICEYCGKEMNRKGIYCSKSCAAKAGWAIKLGVDLTYDWKKVSQNTYECRYNPEVACESRICTKCGWNPEVAKARLDNLMGVTE